MGSPRGTGRCCRGRRRWGHILGDCCLLLVVVVQKQQLVVAAEAAPQLLALTRLMVLEPIKNIFTFDLAVEGEVRRDLLYLSGIRGAHAAAVHLLEDHHLLRRGAPPGGRSLRHLN